MKGDEDYEGEDALGRRKRQLAFVGTCDYVPPEILGEPGGDEEGAPWAEDLTREAPSPFALDWWAYGCVLFQCLAGPPRSAGRTSSRRTERAEKRAARVAAMVARGESCGEGGRNRNRRRVVDSGSRRVRDLIGKLLTHDPFARLGSEGGAAAVRAHAFFAGTAST